MVEEIKIGDKVWTVNNNLEIEEHKILEISEALENGKKIKKYKIRDVCGCGNKREDFFIKRSLAELFIKNFIKNLHYPIGSVVVIKEKNQKVKIGRIKEYKNSEKPYYVVYISDWSTNWDQFSEEDLTMVKDEYIEQFEDTQDVLKELQDLEDKCREKEKRLHKIFDYLEEDLKEKFVRYNRWWVSEKRKLKFKDIFVKHNNNDEW